MLLKTREELHEKKNGPRRRCRFLLCLRQRIIGNDRYCIKCGSKRKLDNQEIATESKEAELKAWINLLKKKERKGMGFLNLNLNLTPELPQMLP